MAQIHGQSEWDQKLGKIDCVFSLYDKMRWKWDAVYLPRGLPNVYSSSHIPPPLPLYLRTPTVPPNRYTWSPWLIEFGDALGGRDGVNSEMHLEGVIERVWRCTGRPWWRELRDALGGRDRASLEMNWEAEIYWTQRCTWWPWSSVFGDALGRRDGVNSEMHLEVMIDWVWRCNGRLWPSEFEMHSVLTHDYGRER